MPQKVDYKLAEECIALYKATYQGNDIAAIHQAYTAHISFPIEDLRVYLNGRAITDTIKVKLGIYTESFVAKYPDGVAGRLTAFLCPETIVLAEHERARVVHPMDEQGPNDDPDPLNLGDLTP